MQTITLHTVAKKKSKWDETNLKLIIRDMGLKVTQQRLIILESLLKGREHTTAQELFETVNKKDPNLGFATVYRFLKQLTENKFVSEVRVGGFPARYEWAHKKDHHDHLTCQKCGAISEFENQEIEDLQKQIAKNFGYILTDHVLELFGICPICQEKEGILPGSN